MNATATYSPDDNKLRLSFVSRLPREDYDRLRSAGFAWAPKQELFVAPMWTPEREDIALEFAGEIDDEDTSLVERAEARAERFENLAEKRAADGARARDAVSAIADGIPLGQPILVGHHSERHARRDAERIENGMRKAISAFETAGYWKGRAAGAIRAAKYKERPDVRARRIKRIEAEERKMAKVKKDNEFALRFWRGGMKFRRKQDGAEVVFDPSTDDQRELASFVLGTDPRLSYLNVAPNSHGSHWSAWDVLRPEGERYTACPTMTLPEIQAIALRVYPEAIERCDRWLAHYAGRLEYERAMLADAGGTVADRTGPEVGGACLCWCSPRWGMSKIIKVNKVSVTVFDNFDNGGEDFTRTIPFDDLKRVMSKAEVDRARDEGRVLREDKRGIKIAPPEVTIEKAMEQAAANLEAVVKSTDEFLNDAPKPSATEMLQRAKELRDQLGGGVKVVSVNQLFPTPPELAARMVAEAAIEKGHDVLEPSAGTGCLLDAMPGGAQVTAVEIDGRLTEALRVRFGCVDHDSPSLRVIGGDFLSLTPDNHATHGLGLFDRVVMNPPFKDAEDIRHIRHAWQFVRPGGRLVALCANGPRQNDQLRPWVFDRGGSWYDLGPGQFDGTQVSVIMLSVDKPSV
jgi:SAM-dependent methyltransferase